ncbi:MAG: hypothetical protein A2931_04125 [Candidatus Niyogibacteria bacterium RIFCSPLOWO2_01_FULL_45_48]|uniref:Uncharacterized protein n=2 Tax=Candidatus Niyogiibacteriota TaxID=1817912 RepID=A0A1G2EYQ4_9BACT|nr:MAG: hypothetical protein A2931_04125 [Candidatus Niyogibacteria bacterium RIFCSPLOWO2_01_FULL_45_48]OGZ30520.1 MAG: hypothetical protein A3J00_03515 [Candidatus Niyogibacteria bacterium RIFCSPLOWO2_02_FULL_45_13]
MLRSRSEIVEMEAELKESVGIAKKTLELAKKNKSTCAFEAEEWLNCLEEQLKTLMQFKDFSSKVAEGALAEVEEKFFPDLAEVLSYRKDILFFEHGPKDDNTDSVLSPALAYNKEGKSKLPASANEARKRAHILWHRKFILEWLLKQADNKKN